MFVFLWKQERRPQHGEVKHFCLGRSHAAPRAIVRHGRFLREVQSQLRPQPNPFGDEQMPYFSSKKAIL